MVTRLEDYVDNRSQQIISPFPRKQIQVFFDGLCQPCNPGGTACFAFIVKNEEGNTIHSEYGLAARKSTNNVAEYTAIIKALEWLSRHNFENQNIIIRGDSLLVINQIEGNFEVRATNIIPLYHLFPNSIICRLNGPSILLHFSGYFAFFSTRFILRNLVTTFFMINPKDQACTLLGLIF